MEGCWKETLYDSNFCMCAAQTNYHAKCHPLRDDDGVFHSAFKSSLYAIGNDTLEKRRIAQSHYRAKCSRQKESTLRGPQVENEEILSADMYKSSNSNVPS